MGRAATEFADQMDKARMLGSFRKLEAGRSSATMSEAFRKHIAILRYLGSIDPTGEVPYTPTFFFLEKREFSANLSIKCLPRMLYVISNFGSTSV